MSAEINPQLAAALQEAAAEKPPEAAKRGPRKAKQSTDEWDAVPEFGGSVRQDKKVKVEGEKMVAIEMMSDELANWMKFQAERLSGGKRRPLPTDADFTDYAAQLISMCLHYEDRTTLVPFETISKWGASTLSGLFDICQKLNGLDADAREEVKKT